MAEVSDEMEENDEGAEADVSHSFLRDVAGTMEIHAVLAVPEPNSDDLPIFSRTPKRKAWNTLKSQANEAPQWKKTLPIPCSHHENVTDKFAHLINMSEYEFFCHFFDDDIRDLIFKKTT